VPAKRGRKPKTDAQPVAETAAQPKRRGRKPKAVKEAEERAKLEAAQTVQSYTVTSTEDPSEEFDDGEEVTILADGTIVPKDRGYTEALVN
jgi:hypothetical protein